MKVMSLKNPFPNGFASKDQDAAQAALGKYQEVYDAIVAGTACIRFIDGDRKGSIARVCPDPAYDHLPSRRPVIGYRHPNSWDREVNQQIDNTYMWCLATWDGRKNKVKVSLPDRDIEVLLDYDGPTVWEKFDAKAAKAELLKNPDQKDINGKVLSIGDPVLYINARYGSRMTLEEGTITEFAASVNSRDHSFATIITSKSGEQSSLQYPESMVYKM